MTAKLNLAPEVYQAGQRAKRKKQIATSIGVGVGLLAGGFIVACLVIIGGQAAYTATLSGDIKNKQNEVASMTDLPKAATAAEHLTALSSLVEDKIYLTNFFQVLHTVTPQGVAVSSVALSTPTTLDINGSARSYSLVTKLAKALEASNVEVGPSASPTNQPFFSGVTLSTVSRSNGDVVDFKLTATMTEEVTRDAN